jgi:hypothetical protein
MTEYTSTRDGFQQAMTWALTGPPGEANLYAESTSLPTFYHILNGERLDYNDYVKVIAEYRAKASDFNTTV